MPLAKIEVRRSRPASEVTALMEAVYLAMREALKVPEDDRQIRYIEHRPEHFWVAPGKSENYTLVEVLMFPGRSMDAKRTLYQGITQRFGALGIAPIDVMVVLTEPPKESWGLLGLPASEIPPKI
ncbi:Tautomerase enzyme [Rhodoferax sp. OV413]|uniref:tautomerase family protein n=1 Tax=Rhodoferax sp. OV413 TaxID=1855285 RepID=UPI0008812C99|nr:tautomerase family protein [Rhodoferax sp. OV413]SDO72135.1 Tautomerase enzyme [Rhodoferax sp. OV413]